MDFYFLPSSDLHSVCVITSLEWRDDPLLKALERENWQTAQASWFYDHPFSNAYLCVESGVKTDCTIETFCGTEAKTLPRTYRDYRYTVLYDPEKSNGDYLVLWEPGWHMLLILHKILLLHTWSLPVALDRIKIGRILWILMSPLWHSVHINIWAHLHGTWYIPRYKIIAFPLSSRSLFYEGLPIFILLLCSVKSCLMWLNWCY